MSVCDWMKSAQGETNKDKKENQIRIKRIYKLG